MGPRKFGLSLYSRKGHANQQREKEHVDWQTYITDSEHLSKAERLLGANSSSTVRPVARPSATSKTSTALRDDRSGGRTPIARSQDNNSMNLPEPTLSIGDLYGNAPISRRASSNVLGKPYTDDGGQTASVTSSVSRNIRHQDSDSTIRSYYDSKTSPLAVSQQTSASAVRDRALRKGQPQILESDARSDRRGRIDSPHGTASDGGPETALSKEDGKRRSKPPRLDLSKLFPKPRSRNDNTGYMLSPSKVTRSPSQLSAASEYFPRHPHLGSSSKSKSVRSKHSNGSLNSRASNNDTGPIENSKMNVRRPPKGIKHWFEGVLEESDEDSLDDQTRRAPIPKAGMNRTIQTPVRKSSLGRVLEAQDESARANAVRHNTQQFRPNQVIDTRIPNHGKEDLSHVRRPSSPSQESMASHTTGVSSKTRMSMSNVDLRSASVLSMSSSEDEDADLTIARNVANRQNSAYPSDEGEILIGKASAYEINPRVKDKWPSRLSKEGRESSRASMVTTSTSSATIDIMFNPSQPESLAVPSRRRPSRRNGHHRYPSSIPENEVGDQNETAHSSSAASSRKGFKIHPDHPRFMAVTEEEEALLEMMRRKRAAMAKHSFTEGYKLALKQDPTTERRPHTSSSQPQVKPRTSGFLMMDDNTSDFMTDVMGTSPGSTKTWQTGSGSSNAVSNSKSDRSRQGAPQLTLPPHLSLPALDPYPSPTQTATSTSVASPTTTSHMSPLPSPKTPVLRLGEENLDVKVAGSTSSLNGEDEAQASGSGTEAATAANLLSKSTSTRSANSNISTRPRTASSGTERSDNVTSRVENESRRTSQLSQPETDNRWKRVSSRKKSNASSVGQRSLSSIGSGALPLGFPTSSNGPKDRAQGSSHVCHRNGDCNNKRSSKRSSLTPSAQTHNSVSEDVLAAWGSLGGVV